MKNTILSILVLALLIGLSTSGYFLYNLTIENKKLTASLSSLESQVSLLEASSTQAQAKSEEEKKTLEKGLSNLSKENQGLKQSLQSLASRPPVTVPVPVEGKSQEELVTLAVEKATPGVLSVEVRRPIPGGSIKLGSGSGFIISRNGYLVTNRHVAPTADYDYVVTLSNGQTRDARFIYASANTDMAVLKIDGTYTPVTLGSSSSLKSGQTVIAIGNALGRLSNTVSVGIVSGLNRTIQARDGGEVETLKGVIQTDAAMNVGHSGGPLIDTEGRVVGINVAVAATSNNISFAIPIDQVRGELGSYL